MLCEYLQSPQSPFLVRLYGTFQSVTHLFYLLEYYPGGDLATLLANHPMGLPEPWVRFYTAEIVAGLQALHGAGIVYRDLKPENVLFDREGHVVLTDFGLSKRLLERKTRPERKILAQITNDAISIAEEEEESLSDSEDDEVVGEARTFCGTAEYLAPEILMGEAYSFPVDLWSLGTLVYEMLCGITPYWAEVPSEMYRRIVETKPRFYPTHLTPDARDFIDGLLQRDPHQRPPVTMLSQHPFLSGLDWPSLLRKQLKPPVVPRIETLDDVRYFEDSFTNLTPRITPSDRLPILPSPTTQQGFQSFSFSAAANSTISANNSSPRTNLSPNLPLDAVDPAESSRLYSQPIHE